MSTHEFAQLSIGIIKGPMDSPVMADFAANLDRINALAEATPGAAGMKKAARERPFPFAPAELSRRRPRLS